MTDRPILFSAPMVRALLDGDKTQTRRILKPQPIGPVAACLLISFNHGVAEFSLGPQDRKPNGDLIWRRLPFPGDRLWVKETWGINHYKYCRPATIPKTRPYDVQDYEMVYFATEDDCEINNEMPRRPSIFMPRWASRLTLTVTDVRVERLQDISEADAIAEGIVWQDPTEEDYRWARERGFPTSDMEGVWTVPGAKGLTKADVWGCTAEQAYRFLWNSINGPGAWDANPWVVAVSFVVEQRNIDQVIP